MHILFRSLAIAACALLVSGASYAKDKNDEKPRGGPDVRIPDTSQPHPGEIPKGKEPDKGEQPDRRDPPPKRD